MILDEREARQLLYCAAEELRARRAGKLPGPATWLVDLVHRLELEVATSRSRQEDSDDLPLSPHEEWFGTRTAAACLGWTTRKVQRHAADLEGQLTSAGWIFPSRVVLEYAAALNDDRDIA